MKTLTATVALMALALATAGPAAAAATAEDCRNAVAQTNNDVEASPEVETESDSMQEEWMSRINVASGKADSDPEECLAIMRGVRGELGLKPLPETEK